MLRIKEIMNHERVTNVELARALHVTPQYVSTIINEKHNVSLYMLKRISDYLNVPLIALFDGYIQMNGVTDNSQVICPVCGHILALVKAE